MLPYFVRQDLEDVVEELNEAGYPLRVEWFAPHFEFRFPLYGAIEHRGIELELRQAIEPWHVLGEEAIAGGTSRACRFFARTTAGAGQRHGRSAARGHLQRQARAAASDRNQRRNSWPACAIAPGSRPIVCIPRSAFIRRWCLTSWIPGREGPLAAARITSCIRAGGAMTDFR